MYYFVEMHQELCLMHKWRQSFVAILPIWANVSVNAKYIVKAKTIGNIIRIYLISHNKFLKEIRYTHIYKVTTFGKFITVISVNISMYYIHLDLVIIKSLKKVN